MLETENEEEVVQTTSDIPKILIKTGPILEPNEILEELFEKDMQRFGMKELKYFNNDQCYSLIENYFPDLVLEAYVSLIPPAFRADLFRYCALYAFGGVYMDLTNTFINDYDIYSDDHDMIMAKDMDHPTGIEGIQISFIACKPKLEFFKYVIERTSIQVLQRQKGRTALDVTGPHAFKRHFVNYFGCDPKSGTNTYTHGNSDYVIKMDLAQTSKKDISKIDHPDHPIISVKSLGVKEHRRLLLDPDILIPSKRAIGIMHEKRVYRKNDYGEYWSQNKVFF